MSYDTSYPPSLWAPKPPAPVPATGATAGTPGSFTPSGSVVPASVPALISANPPVLANPATAWTVGQYVQTQTSGVAGRGSWNGSAWVAGAVAEPDPEPEDDPIANAIVIPLGDE